MSPDRTRKTRVEWTAEEEAVWNEIVAKCLKQHLLPMVRADGRLEGRSIGSHLNAMINKLKTPATKAVKKEGVKKEPVKKELVKEEFVKEEF